MNKPPPDPVDYIELMALEHTATSAKTDWSEPWRDEYGFNNGGVPSHFFFIPEHNGGAKVEMLAEVSQHIVAFQPSKALQLVALAKRDLELESALRFLKRRLVDYDDADGVLARARNYGWSGPLNE